MHQATALLLLLLLKIYIKKNISPPALLGGTRVARAYTTGESKGKANIQERKSLTGNTWITPIIFSSRHFTPSSTFGSNAPSFSKLGMRRETRERNHISDIL